MPPKTSDAIRETIVQWLQDKDNFLLITGAAGFNSGNTYHKTYQKNNYIIIQ
ncbi:MAG: hypothetical protein RLZZ546_2355 [Bacteroidota bacterium]|jgi:uncharacterized phage-like protein YoqJ